MSAAAGTYGGAVLTKAGDEAGDVTAGLGRHWLQRVFGTRDQVESLPEPLADLVADPGDEDARAAVRLTVRRALAADPALAAEVRSVLAGTQAVTQQVRAGRDAYTAAGNQTVINYESNSAPPAWSMRPMATRLALVKDATDLDMRVNRAVLPIPYIRRDAEGQARRYLEAGRPVLLVGSSMVGKTRVAVSLIRDMFADHVLAMPENPDALAALEATYPDLRRAVLFLDDISRLIGAGGVTDGVIHRLAAGGNIIIATVRELDYDRYQVTDKFRSPEWDVLSLFERVFLSRKLSGAEEDRLRAAVPDDKIRHRIIRTGLGEYAGAAQHIDEVLQYGRSLCPAGYALVKGAADWRCAGMKTPVPASLLPALAEPHLTDGDRLRLSDQQSYEDAVQWATRDINPTVALLQRDASGSYSVFDYALDLLAQQGEPIPDASWQVFVQHAEPEDLISLGYTAEVIFGKSDVAQQAWLKATESGHADCAPVAACNLAVAALHQADPKAAQEACQRAMDSGHVDHAPMAAVNLGILLQQQGDLEAARAAYQHAINSGHCDHAPRAWLGLGTLFEEQGNAEDARVAYRRAAESDHADTVTKARRRLDQLDHNLPDAIG